MTGIKERGGNMSERIYRICLTVPLGARNGTMLLHEVEGKVEGWMNVMNEKNRFSGVLSDEGQLTISGVIRTLISTMHYTATGTVSEKNILLNLKTDSGAYYPVFGEEINTDDKVL